MYKKITGVEVGDQRNKVKPDKKCHVINELYNPINLHISESNLEGRNSNVNFRKHFKDMGEIQ